MKKLLYWLIVFAFLAALLPATTAQAQATEILKPTAYTFSGGKTNTSPASAYDGAAGGEDTTFNQLGVGDNSADPTMEYHTWQTPAQSHTARRLYIRREGTVNTDDNWSIHYSINGGTDYTVIETGLITPARDNTTAVTIDTALDLPTNLQVKISTVKQAGPDSGFANIYDVWLEGDYTDISNSPNSYAFGSVSEGASYKTGLTYFTVTNNSAYAVNITISGDDMLGGVTWTLSEDASQGANIYGLRAGREGEVEGNDYLTIVPKSSANTLVSGLASLGTQKWGLQFLAPTSFTDTASKSGTVTLTATQA